MLTAEEAYNLAKSEEREQIKTLTKKISDLVKSNAALKNLEATVTADFWQDFSPTIRLLALDNLKSLGYVVTIDAPNQEATISWDISK